MSAPAGRPKGYARTDARTMRAPKGKRWCPRCESFKALRSFGSGASYCKPCSREYRRQRRAAKQAAGNGAAAATYLAEVEGHLGAIDELAWQLLNEVSGTEWDDDATPPTWRQIEPRLNMQRMQVLLTEFEKLATLVQAASPGTRLAP